MKKLLFIAICFVSLQLSAQGNLQFNQVRTETYVSPGFTTDYSDNIIGTFVVPAGKVFKIESASLIYRPTASYGRTDNQWFSLRLDDHALIHRGNANYLGNFMSNIIWLAEGTYDVIVTVETTSDFTAGSTVTINGIEFNVVP